MIYDLMKRCALLGAAALLAAACWGNKDYGTERTTALVVRFEPEMESDWGEFLYSFFDEGRDTVSINGNFSVGPAYHFAKKGDVAGTFGGMIIARGHDANASADRASSRLAVFDKAYGHQGSKAYAVFHDTTSTLMPDHAVQIYIPNEDSACMPGGMFVHNVQAAVQAAKYGVGLEGGPFQEGDHLTLTVTGLLGTVVAAQVEVKLIDGTKIVDEWKEVSLDEMDKIDAIDMRLTSSRADFPLYCCVDDMWYTYLEVYR